MDAVKDNAAREAEDVARLGYRGRNGRGAQLLKLCADAVRIAAADVERSFNVPAVSADERAEFASDLAARILGNHGGELPDPDTLQLHYLAKRAKGRILEDRHRQGRVSWEVGEGMEPAAAEPDHLADAYLDGPLEVPGEVLELAAELGLSQSGTRALAACMIPATREEWAELFGYGSRKAVHVTVWRGRAELVACGEQAIREALARIEAGEGSK